MKRIIATAIISMGVILWGASDREQVHTLMKQGKYNQAISIVAQLCTEKKDASACKEIIRLYKKGYKKYGIDRNLKKMLYYAKNSCGNGIAIGCRAAGDLYWDAEPSKEAGVQQSLLQAAQYYKKACNAGDKGLCPIGNGKGLIISVIVLPNNIDQTREIKEMLDAGYNVNAKVYEMTPLCAAVKANNFKVARLLIENDADPRIVCDIGGHRLNAFDIAKSIKQKTGNNRMLKLLKSY